MASVGPINGGGTAPIISKTGLSTALDRTLGSAWCRSGALATASIMRGNQSRVAIQPETEPQLPKGRSGLSNRFTRLRRLQSRLGKCWRTPAKGFEDQSVL